LGQGGGLTVVDAKYYHGFEPDAEISRMFKAGLEKHEYYFEGGNFQASSKGDCMIVNNERHAQIPDGVFSGSYGCKQVIRLPFIDGIGHVDERARFINDKTIVTDTPAYKDLLEEKGFTVKLLPRPSQPYETYVNSLIMDGKVVVPVFGQATDAKALAVYESLGLKATGGDSTQLSNRGMGSVHCITMTYPVVPMADMLKALGAKEL
jgi:agmatine/peptidylarginine deiminase